MNCVVRISTVKRITHDSPKLTYLNDLPYTAVELRQEAANRAKKAIHSGCVNQSLVRLFQ
jgi:hypothetical protein